MAMGELDTRADTICASSNFHVLCFTDQTGFHDSFNSLTNIPVAHIATAYTDAETGQVYILVVNETLYFCSQPDHSLISPNQICSGIPVCDNPYNQFHDLGIKYANLVLPFFTKGAMVISKPMFPPMLN
ncbi:hypothetical protein ACHAXS_010799 [Conticribra weissflogii]